MNTLSQFSIIFSPKKIHLGFIFLFIAIPRMCLTQVVAEPAPRMAEFPGGHNQLIAFFTDTTKFPQELQSSNIDHLMRIKVGFIIDEEGIVTEINIIESSMGIKLGKIALKVFEGMPKWIPGKINDQAVCCEGFIELEFQTKWSFYSHENPKLISKRILLRAPIALRFY